MKSNKSETAYRTISEVADVLDLQQHVLRFWETKFSQIKPLKRGGNRRFYRPQDIETLRAIKLLLYRDGYTIRGVQKLFKEQGVKTTVDATLEGGPVEQIPVITPPVKRISSTPLTENPGKQLQDNVIETDTADQAQSYEDNISSDENNKTDQSVMSKEKSSDTEMHSYLIDVLNNLKEIRCLLD